LPQNPDIEQKILEIIKENQPKTVNELIEIAKKELDIPENELLKQIIKLNNQEKLNFTHLEEEKKQKNNWFLVVIFLSIAAEIAIFLIPENYYPYIYIRNVLGLLLVTFLPGYSLISVLFPKKEMDKIEKTALSIGLSLAIVSIIGLILNFTPFGIRLVPVTTSLLAVTIILSMIGTSRER
jgi:uncharacterized membrane protein